MPDDEAVVQLLEELVAWTRFANRNALIAMLDAELKDDRHLVAFELSDGKQTQAQVAKLAGLSQPTVSGLWRKWRRLGIVREVGDRTAHIARPSDLGMERIQRALAGSPKAQASVEASDANV